MEMPGELKMGQAGHFPVNMEQGNVKEILLKLVQSRNLISIVKLYPSSFVLKELLILLLQEKNVLLS